MRRVNLSKWPMPHGYSIVEAALEYDQKFMLHIKMVTPWGARVADQSLYPEQVLEYDSPAFGREVMDHIVNQLHTEDFLQFASDRLEKL